MLHLKLFQLANITHAFRYRDRLAIIGDILSSVRNSKEGRRKTQIMQSANLNYIQTKKYLSYMYNCGFLVITQKETYVMTARGARFLHLIEMQKIQNIR
jgi:predicted transcriptional regulator